MLGQRQQAGLFLRERVRHRPRRIAGHRPRVGHGVAPVHELAIEIVHVAERSGREERLAQVADGALDAAFFPGRAHRAGPGHEVVVTAELEQPGVEADRVPLPLEDGALHIVVEDNPRHPVQRAEGLHVAPQEALERLVEHEDGVQRPRPTQHQDEGGQSPGGAPDGDRAEAAPIGLALFTGEEVQPEIGRGLRRGPEQPDGPAHLADRARVPPLAHHLEQPRRPQAGILLQRGFEEWAVRIERARPRDAGPGELFGRQRAPHRVRVHRKLGGDGPHPPVLGEEEAADLGDLRSGDHASPPYGGWARRARRAGRVLVPADEAARLAAPPAPRAGDRGAILETEHTRGDAIGPPFWPTPRGNRDGRRERGRAEDAAGGGSRGRVMRHARATAQAISALPIAMVEAAFGALLMPAAGRAETAGAPFLPTRETAIGVAAITRGAQVEGLPAQAARRHQEDGHGPAGPERSGGQWTKPRGCATTPASRPRPRGVGVPEGLEGSAPGPHPSPSGVAAAYPKNITRFHSPRQSVRISTLLHDR